MKSSSNIWITVYTKGDSYEEVGIHTIQTRMLIERGSIYGADNLRSRFLSVDDFMQFLYAAVEQKNGVWSNGIKWEQD